MSTWILPIKPKWAKLIYSGEKTVEIRRWVPESLAYDRLKSAFPVLLYETLPVQRITGQCMMRVMACPDCYLVTERELADACLTRDEFDRYTDADKEWSVEFVWLLSVADAHRVKQSQGLADYGLKQAPQSWVRSRRPA